MKLGQLPKVLAAKPGTALLVKGSPGVGKTEVVLDYYTRQIADHAVVKFVAAQETPESVTGFLWINPTSGTCEYLPQRRLKALNEAMKAGKKGVLVIDEYKSGDRMVHNALQQLTREHEVGDWIAAGDLYVVALSNREEDRANAIRLSAPAVNRFEQITVEADFDFWRGWAATEGLKPRPGKSPRVHPDILGWLSAIFIGSQSLKTSEAKEWAKDKNLLFCSPAPKGEEAFPTPRSHEIASDILYKFDGEDEDFVRELLSGSIGTGPAFELMAWRKIGKEAQRHVDSIMAGKKVPSFDVGMQFFVQTALTARLAQDPKGAVGPLVKYIADIESEYGIMMISDCAKVAAKELQNAPGWADVVKKHRKVALAGPHAR
jgi:hypothetical protein